MGNAAEPAAAAAAEPVAAAASPELSSNTYQSHLHHRNWPPGSSTRARNRTSSDMRCAHEHTVGSPPALLRCRGSSITSISIMHRRHRASVYSASAGPRHRSDFCMLPQCSCCLCAALPVVLALACYHLRLQLGSGSGLASHRIDRSEDRELSLKRGGLQREARRQGARARQ